MSIQKQIKQILIELAANDQVPIDMTQLDECVFDIVIHPIVEALCSLKKDAEMALDGSWDCTLQEGIETGFTAQIELIDQILI